MSSTYDAIIVGARCAGSPAAMLLARKGYRVLMVDRVTFPSDTISTHLVHPPAVATLKRWGLLDRLVATGCPPVETYAFDFGSFTIEGAPGEGETRVAYCPRRTILDKLLVDAAADSGAEILEGFAVDELLTDNGAVVGIKGHSRNGDTVSEHARVVIGADGRNSVVAAAVHPEKYNEKPPILALYYAYWSALPMQSRFENYARHKRGFAAFPTHDDQTVIVFGWPYAEFSENKKDIEGHYWKMIDLAPEFAVRVRKAKRETKFFGVPTPNYFCKPYGPGWALLGDAGYIKDPITAQGIRDAFFDAEGCAQALDQFFKGERSFDAAMADHQQARDNNVTAMYEFTTQLALLDPPTPEMQQLLGAIHGNQKAMDGFAAMNAGTISPAQYFSPENIDAILGASPPGKVAAAS